MAKVTKVKKAVSRKRREKKNIDRGQAHIRSSFNNTLVTITDMQGNAIAWSTDSMEGYIHRMSGTLPAIVDALAKFGNSAYLYFH